MSAKSKIGQQLGRALAHNEAAHAIFGSLLTKDKIKFRQSWAMKRSFDFVSEKRIRSSTHRKSTDEVGEFLPLVTIADRLGGSSTAECVKLAKNYAKHAQEAGTAFCSYNAWLECDTYFWLRQLTKLSSINEWREVMESYNMENVWEQKAKFGKAAAAYGAVHNIHPDKVTTEMLEATNIGIAGWSNVQATGVCGDGQATGKAKAKAKSKSKASAKSLPCSNDAESEAQPASKKPRQSLASPIVKAEKEAREIVALYARVELDVQQMMAKHAQEPDSMQWAAKFFSDIKAALKDLNEKASDTIFNDFRVAALSATTLKEHKKSLGDDYLGKLCTLKEAMGSTLNELVATVAKVQHMAQAQLGGSPADAKKRKSK